MDGKPRYDEAVRRAALPEVLLGPDLALATNLPPDVAEAAARSGRFGPHFFIRGQVAVLRKDFLQFLTLRASARGPGEKELLP